MSAMLSARAPSASSKICSKLRRTARPCFSISITRAAWAPIRPRREKAKLAAARQPGAKKQAPEGLNENYARELMELHTLGVNGGYTQADVTQVARVLTGWTVDKPGARRRFQIR
jgi:hypothetical protein